MSEYNFITVENGLITEVRCKLCKAPIQSMVPHEKLVRTEKINGVVVKTVPASLRPNPNYRQIVLEMTDGEKKAKHVTHCCASCLKNMETQHLQKMYAMDLAQWQREGMEDKHLRHLMTFRATKLLGQEPLFDGYEFVIKDAPR